jgi:hypothetical protein
MTTPGGAPFNVASENAHVGVQAQVVHGDVVYQVPKDAAPEEKFRVGVNYLDGGMPPLALKHIDEAAAHGLDSWELRFYRLLALLSGRTLRQFSREDKIRLNDARRGGAPDPPDQWCDGVRIISGLLDSLLSPAAAAYADTEATIKELDGLAAEPRRQILRHLDAFLAGVHGDQMWRLERKEARERQQANDRTGRVWMFFELEPAGARVRRPLPAMTTASDQFVANASAFVLAVAAVYIGWQLLWHLDAGGLAAYAAAVVSGRVLAVNGLELHWLTRRRREMDARYRPSGARRQTSSSDRFASGVDHLFNHYFETWVPDSRDKAAWLSQTSGIRSFLRDEVVEVYREERVKAEQVAWLVRHRLDEVRQAFRHGTLWAYRDQLQARMTTKLAFGGSLTVFALSVMGVIDTLPTSPLASAGLVTIAGLSGFLALQRRSRIAVEQRRAAADQEEYDRRLAGTEAALREWRAKLANKPTDAEMAAWLDCDRKILLDEAMRHYQVPRRRLFSHAFIELPGENYKQRARVRNGPWRYSAYKLLVFLLTDDGVHQVEADLDFRNGSCQERERISFGYNAITAVTASVNKRSKRTFDLGLGNGTSIKVVVTDPSTNLIKDGEDEEKLLDAEWDATSLANTLRVLEGVAAGGKEWIRSRDQM